MSIEPLICSQRKSNLFLKELFRCPNILLLILLIRTFLRAFLASENIVVAVLATFSTSLQVSPDGLRNQFPSIKFNKFLTKTVLPFLFKCSFLMPRCSSFRLSFSISLIFFCFQKFFNREFVSARIFSIFFLSFLKTISKKLSTVSGEVFLTLLTIFKHL